MIICFTGHTMKSVGRLVWLPSVANTRVLPGVIAVTMPIRVSVVVVLVVESVVVCGAAVPTAFCSVPHVTRVSFMSSVKVTGDPLKDATTVYLRVFAVYLSAVEDCEIHGRPALSTGNAGSGEASDVTGTTETLSIGGRTMTATWF